jgi:XapX domain-containing protein
MGLAVGMAYGLIQVRSPVPPLIALVGLLGMVLREQAVDAVRHHVVPSVKSSTEQQPLDDAGGLAKPTAEQGPSSRSCARRNSLVVPKEGPDT